MNNDELKKKIVGIVAMATCEADKLPFVETAEYIANELISAGIGYEGEYTDLNCSNSVEEMIKMCEDCDFPECRGCEHTYIAVLQIDKLKHRAEVAERALDKATELAYEYRTEADTLSCSSCPMFEGIFPKCSERGLYVDCSKRWKEEIMQQAEKELSAELKGEEK